MAIEKSSAGTLPTSSSTRKPKGKHRPTPLGQKFGRLLVLEVAPSGKFGERKVLCQCDCGEKKEIAVGSILSGKTTSCGCVWREQMASRQETRVAPSAMLHGLSGTRTHRIWEAMRARCGNPSHKAWEYYGGRGIAVCSQWGTSFPEFLKDMGEAPEKMTIERIDANKGYEPENCKWATMREQSRNRRTNVMIEYGGRTMCLTDWAAELGIPYARLSSRYRDGMTVEQMFEVDTSRIRKRSRP